MSEIIWSDWATAQQDNVIRVSGLTQHEYIEVDAWTSTGQGVPAVQTEFEVKIWSRGQSTGRHPTHNIIGHGGIERGKKAAEHLLEEGLDRF